MNYKNFFLLFPVLVLSAFLTVGCGGSSEPVVVDQGDMIMTEEEELEYEEESMGGAEAMDDESQN